MELPQHPPHWPLADADALRDELLATYASAERHFHDTFHLSEVLTRLDVLAEAGVEFDTIPVQLAAWFHDSRYDGERDAEERAAAWVRQALPGLISDPDVAEVARLVLLTESHQPEPSDLNGAALSDADLAFFAGTPQRYAAYVAAVRREFAHLDDVEFARGRSHLIEKWLAKPSIFHTAHGRASWEETARANLSGELAALRAGSVPTG